MKKPGKAIIQKSNSLSSKDYIFFYTLINQFKQFIITLNRFEFRKEDRNRSEEIFFLNWIERRVSNELEKKKRKKKEFALLSLFGKRGSNFNLFDLFSHPPPPPPRWKIRRDAFSNRRKSWNYCSLSLCVSTRRQDGSVPRWKKNRFHRIPPRRLPPEQKITSVYPREKRKRATARRPPVYFFWKHPVTHSTNIGDVCIQVGTPQNTTATPALQIVAFPNQRIFPLRFVESRPNFERNELSSINSRDFVCSSKKRKRCNGLLISERI